MAKMERKLDAAINKRYVKGERQRDFSGRTTPNNGAIQRCARHSVRGFMHDMTTKPGEVRCFLLGQLLMMDADDEIEVDNVQFILASDYDAAMAVKDAEIARLREGLGKIATATGGNGIPFANKWARSIAEAALGDEK